MTLSTAWVLAPDASFAAALTIEHLLLDLAGGLLVFAGIVLAIQVVVMCVYALRDRRRV